MLASRRKGDLDMSLERVLILGVFIFCISTLTFFASLSEEACNNLNIAIEYRPIMKQLSLLFSGLIFATAITILSFHSMISKRGTGVMKKKKSKSVKKTAP
jgi:hypothetical protein